MRSTLGAIATSLLNWLLHVIVALMVTINYYGQHQQFWAFIVLSLIANVLYIAVLLCRNVVDDDVEDSSTVGQPTQMSLKLQERFEEAVLLIIGG